MTCCVNATIYKSHCGKFLVVRSINSKRKTNNMASLQKYNGTNKNKNKTYYRIQPVLPNGKRTTIHLGTGLKAAEVACKAIGDLIDSNIAGVAPSAKTKSWIEQKAKKKTCELLAKHGLIDIVPKRHEMSQVITVEIACDKYISEFSAGKSPRTVTTYRQAKQVAIEYFGELSIEQIGPSEARLFWAWMITTRNLAQNTAKVRLRNLRTIFDLAIESEVITKNPFKAKGLTTTQTAAEKTYVTVEVIEKIIRHCPSDEWKVFFRLIRAVPMRIPSEVQELTWSDIDTAANTILVHSPKTRHIGKAARLVRLFEDLQNPLKELQQSQDNEQYVFPNIRKLSNIGKLAGDIVKKAGVETWPYIFNSIRASTETDLMDEYGLRLACQWAGNSASTAMKNYALVRSTDFDDSGIKSDTVSDAQTDAVPASTDKQVLLGTQGAIATQCTESYQGAGEEVRPGLLDFLSQQPLRGNLIEIK